MPASGNKEKSPFKTMDIKSALMSGGSRKRKASTSQELTGVKNVKISLDSEEDKDIGNLDEVCGVTNTFDQTTLNMSPSDSKENKDINSSGTSGADKKENLELVNSKDDSASNKNTEDTISTVNKTRASPKLSSSPITVKSELNIMEVSDNSYNSSCDELSTSAIDSAVNVSLNTSGITGDEKEVKAECSNDAVNINKIVPKDKSKKKKMTPAEAKKRAEEREQKQRERLLKKQEIENKKQERLLEKERKEKEKLVRKEREEIERKEREKQKQEKKQQEEKEKLLKQKEKEEKLQKKVEEQKKKEELRLKKEEEFKRAEEEKIRKEQKEKEKAERAKAAFVKFFIKGDSSVSTPITQVPEKEGAFLPFQVSDDMILAPVVPPAAQERFDRKQLDNFLKYQDGKDYLQILKSGLYKVVRHRKRTCKLATSEADVIVIDNQAGLGLRAKLLQFSENVRPPYWGTWRKKSKNIRPRNPFGQCETFDYSVDSDDEWDEGGPGESLSGTENEDEDNKSENDYEVDNEFMVPHGYLSDEEEKIEDDEEMNKDPETQKDLLKKKNQEFEMERKKKVTELKPLIIGCYFSNDPRFQDPRDRAFLQNFAAEVITDSPIPTRFTFKKQQTSANLSESPNSSNCTSFKKKKTCPFPENAMPQLIKLIHGNIRNKKALTEEFQKLWTGQNSDTSVMQQETTAEPTSMEVDESKNTPMFPTADSSLISLRQLSITIKEIATYGKPPESSINKCCWWVHESVREKYGLLDVPLPNHKNYVSFPSVKVEDKQLAAIKGPSIKEFLSSKVVI